MSGLTGKWIDRRMDGWMNHVILNSLLDVIMYLKRLLTILEHQLTIMVSDLYVRYLIMSLLFTVDFESKYGGDDDESFDMVDLWKHVSDSSRSIEINYETKDNKEILTRVYFPFHPSVSTWING